MNVELRLLASPDEIIILLKALNIDASSLIINMVQDENAKFNSITDIDKVKIIKQEVSKVYEVSIEHIESKSRKRQFVDARHEAMSFIVNYTDLSLKRIGSTFGNKDHSTVIHAIENVKNLIQTNSFFKEKHIKIKAILDDIFNPKQDNNLILT